MAKLTIAVASCVAGVARSTLYRAIQTGRLSADPDGRIDTAELLRAGYTLQRSAQQTKDVSPHDATRRNTEAQQPSDLVETQGLHALQQERDRLRLERDMLRQQLEAAQMREQAALEREREAREERQAGREREAALLEMLRESQSRYDRLLAAPSSRPEGSPSPDPATGSSIVAPRGEMRRRILDLLQEHPDGLAPSDIARLLGVNRNMADTLAGMRRYGLVERVGYGRYVVGKMRQE